MGEQKKPDAIQVALVKVRRRELLTRLLEVFSLHLLICLSLFALYLLAEKLFAFSGDTVAALAAALSLAVLSTLARWIWLMRFSIFDAAVLADERLRLKERLSSAFHLRRHPDTLRDPAWTELIQRDGERCLERVDLSRHFPIRAPWSARWLLAPVALTVLFTLIPPVDLFGIRKNRLQSAEMRKEVQRKKEELAKELEKLREEAKKPPDPEVEKALEKFKKSEIEKPEKKENRPPAGEDIKREAMVKFTRLEQALKKSMSRDQYDKLKQFLDRFPPGSRSQSALTGKIQQALKDGDFSKAQKEMEKLSKELEALLRKKQAGELTKEEEEKLKQLSEELARLARNSKLLAKLSSALKGASTSMSAGDLAKALENMEALQDELLKLQRLAEDLKFLEDASELVQLSLEDLANLQRCPDCGQLSMTPGG